MTAYTIVQGVLPTQNGLSDCQNAVVPLVSNTRESIPNDLPQKGIALTTLLDRLDCGHSKLLLPMPRLQ